MLNETARTAFDNFKQSAISETTEYLTALQYEQLAPAAELIRDIMCKGNRLHITGIGKPAHVAAYAASLFSSTGTPAYFLHGTEAVHGSCGQLVEGDTVICISNSGETAELKSTVLAIKNNGCSVIGLTGGMASWLAKESDACIFAGVSAEGGPLNRAPRNSVTAEILALAALSAMLQADCGLTPEQYVRRHPGGALGAIRDNER